MTEGVIQILRTCKENEFLTYKFANITGHPWPYEPLCNASKCSFSIHVAWCIAIMAGNEYSLLFGISYVPDLHVIAKIHIRYLFESYDLAQEMVYLKYLTV